MTDRESLRRELEAEYGTYVAVDAIHHDGVRAYNAGDPVPASNVRTHGYDKAGLVTKTTRKDG